VTGTLTLIIFFLQPIDHWLPIRDAHTAQARGVQEASISMTWNWSLYYSPVAFL